ncbi:hypothetical protein DRW07_06410 [Alteromonas sediminis]|uniref:AsmA family protein n=1 Tax=Alteromonas sediminis TaxID=2259342 RepID=A0A3N5Y353_9ALTE|nr:hypothetical protein [Alteromonas sediminis]RPJ67166.1 hypothetical protein DRW07_06410 [Alteromonas sediminis]
MKKVLIAIVVFVALLIGGIVFLLGSAGDLIKQQVETQGTRYLGTSVTLASAELAITEGKLTLSDFNVANPSGFSEQSAFSFSSVAVDIGQVSEEPYTVQTISVNAPEVLYEVDAKGKGKGNLLVLKDNIQQVLPKRSAPAKPSAGPNPLVIVDDVQITKVKLKLNFEQLDTGEFNLPVDQRTYDITLPTFSAGAIGQPNGLPADQVGAAIVEKMLDNIIAQAKNEAEKRLKDAAKAKAKEKLDEKKQELEEKAKSKLKDLLGSE